MEGALAGEMTLSKKEPYEQRVIEDFRMGQKTRDQAAECLQVSKRTITRRAKRVRGEGLEGLKHRNAGGPPTNGSRPASGTNACG